MEPWTKTLSDELLKLFPLPPGLEIAPDGIPEPRASIVDCTTPLSPEATHHLGYFTVTVSKNTRITAAAWYQDVRHFELDASEDLEYVILVRSSIAGTHVY